MGEAETSRPHTAASGDERRGLPASNAPYKATIEIDLWAWNRDEAWSILGQLVTALEKQVTNRNGGTTVHHGFVRADLWKNRELV